MDDFGTRLRQARAVVGWSQPRLAKVVFVSQSFVSKVETGAESASAEFALACDEALQAGGALAALVPARHVPGADDVEGWQLIDALTSTRVSLQTLRQIRRDVLGYAARYPQATPADLLPLVRRPLRRVQQALRHPIPLDAHEEAVRLLALLAGLAGNLALDQQEHYRSIGYFEAGRLASEQTGDRDALAWVLAMASLVPFYENRTFEAVALLDDAVTAAGTTASARRRAWVHALRARAVAGTGAGDAAMVDLQWAHDLLDTASDPEGTDFFDSARLSGLTGTTMLLAGRVAEAEAALLESAASRKPDDAKGRALVALDLAACRILVRDVESAESLIGSAMTLVGSGVVSPIRSRAQVVATDMMAVDPAAGRRVEQRIQAAAVA